MSKFNIPRFKRCFDVKVLSSEKVLLSREKGDQVLLQGRSYAFLAPYLYRNRKTIPELVRCLKKSCSKEIIQYALFRLETKGYLEEAVDDLLPPAILNLCDLLGINSEKAKKNLDAISVSIHSVEDLPLCTNSLKNRSFDEKIFPKNNSSSCFDIKKIEEKFSQLAIRTEASGVLRLLFSEDYRHKKLKIFNRESLKTGKPWILIKPVGLEVWIGPLFIPHQTACLECLWTSMNPLANKESSFFLTSESIAIATCANEIFKWIVQGENPIIEGKVLSFSPVSSQFSSHQLIRNPRCSACGNPRERRLSPFCLESQSKKFTEDGGHRVLSPAETLQKYHYLVSPITGIIDRLIPTATSAAICTPGYVSLGNRHKGSSKILQVLSGGKGKSHEQAKASCLCEAAERCTNAFRGDERMQRASYEALGSDAFHPSTLLNFSAKQYQNRVDWNRDCHEFHWIPSPFDETKKIAWSPIWSLKEERYKWIPTAYCYFSYPFKSDQEKFCIADSNGCAAGNTKEEAILQGFFELVERDCIALWWYSRVQRPLVDLSSFQDPYISQLCSHYASFGRELWAIDLTHDLEIPAFAAVSRISGGGKEEIIFGFGAHFDPKIAILRALTETNQSFDCISFLKQENLGVEYKLRKQWISHARLRDYPCFLPNNALPCRTMQDYARFDTNDLKTDILICQEIVEKKGMEILILEQTRPEIQLPVVRVVVPGLRHMWNRFAPGRLYDVPFQLGWVKEKLKEEDLNPIPMFI